MRAVILLGGPNKGTRFRPLSLDIPKPLFPVGGIPIIQQQIEQCIRAGINEIFLLGFYPQDTFDSFIRNYPNKEVKLKYLYEYEPLSTAGGLFHYRDTFQKGAASDENLLFLNSDVCNLYPLEKLIKTHKERNTIGTVLCATSENERSKAYGCLVLNESNGLIEHYVEKPDTFVSETISCGIYLFKTSKIFPLLKEIFNNSVTSAISMERDVLPHLTNQSQLSGCISSWPFAQIKSASSAVSVSAIYLEFANKTNLASGKNIIGDVFIHPTAKVDTEAKIGPNVTIGPNAIVKQGARIRNAIILDDTTIEEHAVILDAVIGWESNIGCWSRVEGTLPKINPNMPHARVESDRLFDDKGKFIPQCSVLGRGVKGNGFSLAVQSDSIGRDGN